MMIAANDRRLKRRENREKTRRHLPKRIIGLAIAGMILTAVFCIAPAAAASDFAFITTTDYSTGSSSVISCGGTYSVDLDVEPVHSDAVSRWYDGLVYVVNRGGGDNIQVLDPASGFSTLRQFSVGNGSNPQDIAFASPSKAYVSRYDTNDLWIVDPSTGAHTGTISLASLADGDGLCEMDKMIEKDGLLFVTVQRLDRDYYWLPSGTSYVAVIDCAADTLLDTDPVTPGVQPITLSSPNPYSRIQFDPYTGKLYVSCVGMWAAADGGVEIIDPGSLQSEGLMINETEAGGDICDVQIFNPGIGYAIISNASFHTDLIRFNPSTGVKTGTIYSPGAYVLNDIEISPGGELFASDATPTAPGVRIYSAWDGSPIAGPLDTGLPPYDICFNADLQTDSDPVPPPAALRQNHPNPFNPSTTIPFTLKEPRRVTIAVFDAKGRRVSTLAEREFDGGLNTVSWDGRDRLGGEAASGVYFVRLKAAGFRATKKMILLR